MDHTGRSLRNPFDNWMVQRNLEYVQTEGLETVLTRLRRNGYFAVASQVELISNSDPITPP